MTYIYFIRAGSSGPIKIGQSEDPRERLMQLQTAHYETLTLIGFIKHDDNAEHRVHEIAIESRIRGEWFAPTSALVSLIENLLKAGACSTGPEIVSVKSLHRYDDRVYVPKPESDLAKALDRHATDADAARRTQIIDTIRTTEGNIEKAAKLLNCSRRTLQNQMHFLGIPRGRAGRPRKK